MGESVEGSGNPGDKKKQEKPKKLKLAEAYDIIAKAMNGEIQLKKAFHEKFYVVEPQKGIRNILFLKDEGGKVVEYCHEDAVSTAISQYVTKWHKNFAWEPRHTKGCLQHWLSNTQPIGMPAPFLWANDDGLTFRRLPWSSEIANPFAETPIMDEILLRISTNRDAFIEFIGSLFFFDSDRQQYLWLYGDGLNSKGALARLIKRVFGEACKILQPPEKGDKAWTHNLEGVRVVIFPDCNNAAFVSSGLFKSLTGGDAVYVEPKFKSGYNIDPSVKFIFLSNELPKLSSSRADLRRPIFCEMAPIVGDADPSYDQKLWSEAGIFLPLMRYEYDKKYPEHGPIKTDQEPIRLIASQNEERFEVCIDQCFNIHSSDSHQMLPIVFESYVHRFFHGCRREKAEFRKYIARKYKVEKRAIKLEGKVEYRYFNVSGKLTEISKVDSSRQVVDTSVDRFK